MSVHRLVYIVQGFLLNDRMQTALPLQSVTVVSVLEQEKEKKKRGDRGKVELRLPGECTCEKGCEILYWHTLFPMLSSEL